VLANRTVFTSITDAKNTTREGCKIGLIVCELTADSVVVAAAARLCDAVIPGLPLIALRHGDPGRQQETQSLVTFFPRKCTAQEW
jgi:hypothetical protein